MAIDILMPVLSPTMLDGTLTRWMIRVGDKVSPGDVIAEIETDKSVMEVQAVDEGVVEAILVADGAEAVKVHTPIARLASVGGTLGVRAAAPVATEPVSPAPARGAARAPTTVNAGRHHFVSPLARRVAAESGLDPNTLTGSGPHGRVVRRDVEAAARREPDVTLEQMGIAADSYQLKPLDNMRRTLARRMTESFRDVPHFALTADIPIDELLAARAALNEQLRRQDIKISLNDMIIKAAATALGQSPQINASYTSGGIALHRHADIAIAVALEDGLVTPIVRSAETKSLVQIAAETRTLTERARARQLQPAEFRGGTFTVSNLGAFGIKSFTSILNQPQSSILSVGMGEKRAVVRNEQLAIATIMTVTLTCDHRVIDGASGARFLQLIKQGLQQSSLD
jgi:pyruvate dehydrogenase E2 component (dihydrolipoamide acetyltransferase)